VGEKTCTCEEPDNSKGRVEAMGGPYPGHGYPPPPALGQDVVVALVDAPVRDVEVPQGVVERDVHAGVVQHQLERGTNGR
jgi:hypothetical protein